MLCYAVVVIDASYLVVQRFRKQRLLGLVRVVSQLSQPGGGVVAQKERQRCENQSIVPLCDRVTVTRPDLECCVSLEGVRCEVISKCIHLQ